MSDYVSTTNACRLCAPLGACLAFRGVEGAMTLLHGSQGCATYMRRYLISHFREPVDIASSALGEKEAIYGGAANLKQGIANVIKKYDPKVIGVATTCLTETIGDDVPRILSELSREWKGAVPLPKLVNVATPSYQGSHTEGFHATVRALVQRFAGCGESAEHGAVNILPGPVSPEDIRHLRSLAEDFGLRATILPDYSESLDGPSKAEYEPIPEGGTPLSAIEAMGSAAATLELGRALAHTASAGKALKERCGTNLLSLGLPVGLRESDGFFAALSEVSGRAVPRAHALDRGRLVDAYVDGHKYLFGKRAVVYGEDDLVIGLASLLAETGVIPVLCATGMKSGKFAEAVGAAADGLVPERPVAVDGVDFHEIGELARELRPDLVIGNSKGYQLARSLGAPLVRIGFPVHDRFGGQRFLSLGYKGALRLYDQLVNTVLEVKQNTGNVGYGYL